MTIILQTTYRDLGVLARNVAALGFLLLIGCSPAEPEDRQDARPARVAECASGQTLQLWLEIWHDALTQDDRDNGRSLFFSELGESFEDSWRDYLDWKSENEPDREPETPERYEAQWRAKQAVMAWLLEAVAAGKSLGQIEVEFVSECAAGNLSDPFSL